MTREDIIDIERQCERLSLDYAHYVDTGHTDLLAGLFTEDCVLQVIGPPKRGREDIRKTMIFNAPYYAMHVCTNIRITVKDAHNAEGTTFLTYYSPEAIPEDDKPAEAVKPTLMGIYYDQFRKTAEGWRIARREMKILYCKPGLLE